MVSETVMDGGVVRICVHCLVASFPHHYLRHDDLVWLTSEYYPIYEASRFL